MSDWTNKLFIERADLFLKLLNQRWLRTEELVNGMARVLSDYGIEQGRLLDLCCGNGRVSINMAKRGFIAVGVDISRTFLKDAKRRAEEHGVSRMVTFLEGDVRELKSFVNRKSGPFDVVVSAWTSIGFYSEEDDLNVFRQARELSKPGAVLFIAETMHTGYLSIKFAPASYAEVDGMLMLEDRNYDPTSGRMRTAWLFYERKGQDLHFVDRVDIDHRVYSLTELCSLIRKAGWEIVAHYGNLSTLQPMTPLTHMNIVARAR
jgi:ubiquinone/menaquinone biosynthesis C-methylase UbiE